jgi:hypothetical protein
MREKQFSYNYIVGNKSVYFGGYKLIEITSEGVVFDCS